MSPLKKVVICGVGLIGGSFARALRLAGAVTELVGMGHNRATLRNAVSLGVIDRFTDDWADALAGADLVLLATPVGAMPQLMVAMQPHLGPKTLVTDGGSTKRDVVVAARLAFGPRIGQFVPGHPIAGAEKSGVEASTGDLFLGKKVILTPLPENPDAAVMRVEAAWRLCGARVSQMPPEDHDRIFAAVSHMPHVLAFALVDDIAQREDARQLLSLAGSGFRDLTRIASSHPEMWRDICLANRDYVVQELDALQAALSHVRVLLQEGDGAALEALFAHARGARNAWLSSLTGK